MSPTTKSGPKRKPLKCDMCNGSGSVPDGTDERGRARSTTCSNCGGNGEL